MKLLLEKIEKNKKRFAARLRDGLNSSKSHRAYTDEDMVEMFGPYLEEFSHESLSPREVRLIETVIELVIQPLESAARPFEFKEPND